MFHTFRSAFSTVVDTVSGIGTYEDPSKRFVLSEDINPLTTKQITAAYTNSGLIQKIIEFLPNKARQADFLEISPQIETGFNDLGVLELFKQASISARLYKECYLLLSIPDRQELSEPLDKDNVIPISELILVESDQLTFKCDSYQNRLFYELKLDNNEKLQIHPDRVLMFCGKYFTPKVRAATNGYHGSLIQGVMPSYGTYKFSLSVASSLLSRLVTFVFKMKNLNKVLERGESQAVIDRLKLHKKGIGSVGGLIIDSETEDIDWLTFSLAGISEVINIQKDDFTAETELSHDILWNEGSNNTASELELTNTKEKINEYIECYWEENLNILAQYLTGDSTATVKYGFETEIKETPENTTEIRDTTNSTTEN